MNTKHTALLTIAIAAIACHSPIPEGRYPCATATVTRDCPPSWFCRADQRCWMTADTDAGVHADAAAPDAPMTDTLMTDAGPHCAAEVCNGVDDDCDGLIDEGVMTVGPAVMATSGTTRYFGATLVATSAGFGIVTATAATPPVQQWISIDAMGAPPTSIPPLGADNSVDPFAIVTPTEVLYTHLAGLAAPTPTRVLFGFDPATGARRTGIAPFTLPFASGRTPRVHAQFVGTGRGRITLYASHGDPNAPGPDAIRRFRIDVSVEPPVLRDVRDVASDVTRGWAALQTGDADYVVYYRSTNEVVLAAGPTGDATGAFHLVGVLSGPMGPRLDYASLAIRDPSMPVSPSNPLGVAWSGRDTGSGPAPAAFLHVTGTTVLAASSPSVLGDSNGAWGSFFTTHAIELLALRDSAEHWLLVNQDSNAAVSGGSLQVREIIGAGSTVRRIDVPGEVDGPRGDIGTAISGSTVRVVEQANGPGLVTRAIGCN